MSQPVGGPPPAPQKNSPAQKPPASPPAPTMPKPQAVAEYRQKMRRRLDTMNRRHQELRSAAADRAPAEQITDDFSQIITEFRSIGYAFAECCTAFGLQKEGDKRANLWRDANLSPAEVDVWNEAKELRDFHVHHDPVDATHKPRFLVFRRVRDGARLTFRQERYKVASPRLGEVNVVSFCGILSAVAGRFVHEFHQLL
jgi:hypothetical protein